MLKAYKSKWNSLNNEWNLVTWLTEFRIDRIRVVLQKGYVLYV